MELVRIRSVEEIAPGDDDSLKQYLLDNDYSTIVDLEDRGSPMAIARFYDEHLQLYVEFDKAHIDELNLP